MTSASYDSVSRGVGRLARGRVLHSLAPLTVGLAVTATAMAGACTWQARDASRSSRETAREMALSQAYQDINSAANREYSAQLRYLSTDRGPAAAGMGSTQIARFAQAQSDLRTAVERVKSLGTVEDKTLATFVLMEDRQYSQNARTVFADVEAGRIAEAQHLATTITGPRVDILISRVASAAATRDRRSKESMARLTERSRLAAIAIPSSFGLALLLLGGCWVILLQLNKAVRYQASALLAEKQLLSTVIESSPYFVYWKDTDGRYLGANRAFERLRRTFGQLRTAAATEDPAVTEDRSRTDPLTYGSAARGADESDARPMTDARVPGQQAPEHLSTRASTAGTAPVAIGTDLQDRGSGTQAVTEAGNGGLIQRLIELERHVQAAGVAAMDQQATVRSPDGEERRLLFSVLPRPGPHRPEGVIGVGVDVTRLTDLERQLATASRLESVGRLAAGLAHEINTPVQVLSANTQFVTETTEEILANLRAMHLLSSDQEFDAASMRALIEGLDMDFLQSEIPKAMSDTRDCLQRVTDLVRAMKDFAHGGEGLGPCQLNEAVQSVVEISRHEWSAVADLHLSLDPSLETVICHEGEVKESLLAMIVNASQAVADKREKLPGMPRGVIEVATQATPGAVRVVVGDNGIGMDDDVRRKVFDPFFTTRTVGKGSGQGLNFAYRAIVIHHGGSIDVTSVPGEGSAFTITLPTRTPDLDAPP
jgi:signal transduction histidine kinase